MDKHIVKFGFTPGYHRWIHHGEADHIREEVVRPWLEAFDDDAGVADMLDDTHQAQLPSTHPRYRPRMYVQETLPRPCGLERGEVGGGLVVGQVQARLG